MRTLVRSCFRQDVPSADECLLRRIGARHAGSFDDHDVRGSAKDNASVVRLAVGAQTNPPCGTAPIPGEKLCGFPGMFGADKLENTLARSLGIGVYTQYDIVRAAGSGVISTNPHEKKSMLSGDIFLWPADGLALAFGTPITLAADAAVNCSHSVGAADTNLRELVASPIESRIALPVERITV